MAPDEGEDLDGFVCEGVEMESDASSSDSSDPASEDDFVPHLEEFLTVQKGRHPFGDADRKELEALEARDGLRASSKSLAGQVVRGKPKGRCSTEHDPMVLRLKWVGVGFCSRATCCRKRWPLLVVRRKHQTVGSS